MGYGGPDFHPEWAQPWQMPEEVFDHTGQGDPVYVQINARGDTVAPSYDHTGQGDQIHTLANERGDVYHSLDDTPPDHIREAYRAEQAGDQYDHSSKRVEAKAKPLTGTVDPLLFSAASSIFEGSEIGAELKSHSVRFVAAAIADQYYNGNIEITRLLEAQTPFGWIVRSNPPKRLLAAERERLVKLLVDMKARLHNGETASRVASYIARLDKILEQLDESTSKDDTGGEKTLSDEPPARVVGRLASQLAEKSSDGVATESLTPRRVVYAEVERLLNARGLITRDRGDFIERSEHEARDWRFQNMTVAQLIEAGYIFQDNDGKFVPLSEGGAAIRRVIMAPDDVHRLIEKIIMTRNAIRNEYQGPLTQDQAIHSSALHAAIRMHYDEIKSLMNS